MIVNIGMWMERNAYIFPQKVALRDDYRSVSYRESNLRIRALAEALRQQGVRHGDRVAVLLPNTIDMVEVLFATARLGAMFVPLNWRLGEDELVFILQDCTPKALVYAKEWEDRVVSIRKRYTDPCSGFATAFGHTTSAYEQAIQQALPLVSNTRMGTTDGLVGGGDDGVMIIYTSGTTGLPKGVVLTHNNVFWHTINGWSLGAGPDGIVLVLLPLFHVGGLNGSVTPVLHIGGTVILQQKFDPKVVLQTIERDKVTGVLGVPTIYQILAQQPEFETLDWSHRPVLLSGGAPLPESLIQQYHAHHLEFRQGYGLTEASPGVTGMGPGECLRKAGSAGRPILYTEIKLVDAQDQEVASDESGEVVVRGPNVMKGYWNRPEATAEAIRDGWLHTGDIGRFDEDGFLYIVDRKKDMIISGGENIYPAEIEKILAGHPGIQMATVVRQSDERWGEVPVAVLVPADPELSSEQIHAYLQERLARYKLPKTYHWVSELPLNAAGKVIKAEVRKRLGIQ